MKGKSVDLFHVPFSIAAPWQVVFLETGKPFLGSESLFYKDRYWADILWYQYIVNQDMYLPGKVEKIQNHCEHLTQNQRCHLCSCTWKSNIPWGKANIPSVIRVAAEISALKDPTKLNTKIAPQLLTQKKVVGKEVGIPGRGYCGSNHSMCTKKKKKNCLLPRWR